MLHPTSQYPSPPAADHPTPKVSASTPSSAPPHSPSPLAHDHADAPGHGEHSFVVIGGGTGTNHVLSAFQGRKTTFVVPVSDDGGSSSEIQRVLGGPALGDIRSRLIRLIPPSPPNSPLDCIRRLLEYRLPGGSVSSREVKAEWGEIVEGSHKLWRGFNFKKASVGNLFLSGASLFLGSVPAAIFLFASLTSIPLSSVSVLPVINTSSSVTIAAELEDGRIIAGQSEISHPSKSSLFAASAAADKLGELGAVRPSGDGGLTVTTPGGGSYFPLTRATTPSFPDPPVLGAEEDDDLSFSFSPTSPDPNKGQSESTSTPVMERGTNLEFSKDKDKVPPLESRIRRVFYLNAYGSEIFPRPNGLVLDALQKATCLVYAPGSLYTSILPCLELRPVGRLISRSSSPLSPTSPSSSSSQPANPTSSPSPSPLQYKLLLLNSLHDRETPAYDALDFVYALTEACGRSAAEGGKEGEMGGGGRVEPREVVTHVLYLPNGEVQVDEEALRALGIVPVRCAATATGLFDDEVVREAVERIFAGEVD
ncbi:hypothetical protein JCM8097_001185 [Rhodosporidiobolus ruineniae]